MKYSLYHKTRGEYKRKLKEDHILQLFKLYQIYGIDNWRSDDVNLPENKSQKQYFLEKMFTPFHFIEVYKPTKDEREYLKPNEKQMVQYKITPLGLKILIQLEFSIKDEHIVYAAKETLRS